MNQLPGGNLRAAAIGLGAMAVLATHDALIKLLGARYSPFQTLFFVALFSLPMVGIALARGRRRHGSGLWPRRPGWVMLRSAVMVGSIASAMYAFAVLPLAQTYALLFTMPLWVTLLAIPLLGERVGLHRALAILAGMGGVLIALRLGETRLTAGHVAALTSALCSALSGVIARRLGGVERTATLLFWPVAGSLLVAGIALPGVFRAMPVGDLGLVLAIAVLNLLGNALIVAAYRAGEAAIVAPMQYSQFLWAVFYGWLLFAERPDARTLTGVTLIVAAGLYIVTREQRLGRASTRPASTIRPRSR